MTKWNSSKSPRSLGPAASHAWIDDAQISVQADAGKWLAAMVPAENREKLARGLTEKTGLGRGAVQRMGGQLEIRQQEEAVRGWKGGRLVIQDKKIRLNGARLAYGVEAEATCLIGEGAFIQGGLITWNMISGGIYSGYPSQRPDPAPTPPAKHDAPHIDCECGFYATKERKDADAMHATFDVELSGRVIHHEKGYRSQKQRVLRVVIPACEGLLCTEPATTTMWKTEAGAMFGQLCDDHTPLVPAHGYQQLSLAEIADNLGTEVVSEPYVTKE